MLGIRLVREPPRTIPWVDYSSGSDAYGIEIKAVTPEEYHSLGHKIDSEPVMVSEVLTRRWWVLIDLPTMDNKFREVPDFPPDPDEATIARLAEAGLIVQRRDARIAEWKSRFDGGPIPVPQIRGLAHQLESDFALLEADGIENTRGARATSLETMRALRRISATTGDAICMSHDPFADEAPGIELHASIGYARHGPDTLAHRINEWLASPLSSNLRDSLTNGA